MREQVCDRAFLDDLPGVHHGQGLTHFGYDTEIMSDEEYAGARCGHDLPDQIENLGLDRHVKARRGLVQDDQLRGAEQRHGDHDPLAHPSAQLVWVLASTALRLVDLDPTQHLDGEVATFAAFLRDPVEPGHPRELMTDREHRVQGAAGILEDERDVLAPKRLEIALRGPSRDPCRRRRSRPK